MYMATTGAPPPDQDGDPMKMFAALCPGKHYLEGVLIHLVAFAPTPRMIKNHLPLSLYPADALKKGKVGYAARDPRDVIVSLYHFFRLHLLFGYKGALDQLIDDIINDTALFTPYWEHLKEAWDLRDHPNLCFIFFEDLKEDPCREIKRVDKFLGTNRTDEQIKNDFPALKERSKTDQPTSNSNLYFNKEVEKKEGGFFRKVLSIDFFCIASCYTWVDGLKLIIYHAKCICVEQGTINYYNFEYHVHTTGNNRNLSYIG